MEVYKLRTNESIKVCYCKNWDDVEAHTGDYILKVEKIKMSKEEFEHFPEFDGF